MPSNNNETSSIYFQCALAAYNQQDYQVAIENCNLVIAHDPDHRNAYFLRGKAYYELEQYDKAIADYTMAINCDPRPIADRPVINRLVNVQHVNLDIKKISAELVTDLHFAADCYNAIAHTYSKMKKYERTIDNYTQAIRLNPYKVEFYAKRGYTYLSLGQFEHARNDYTAAINLCPEEPLYYQHRATALLGLNLYREACADYTIVITQRPQDAAISYANRAHAYLSWGQFEHARNDYTAAINLCPQEPLYYYHRATALLGLNLYREACADYTIVITQRPQDAAIPYANRGQAYALLEEYDNAIVDFTESLRLNPEQVYTYKKRSNAYLALKQYDKSIEDLFCAHAVNFRTREFDRDSIWDCNTYELLYDTLNRKIASNPQESVNYFRRGKMLYYYTYNMAGSRDHDDSQFFWDYVAAEQWAKPTENFSSDLQFNLTSFPAATQAFQPVLAASIAQLKQSFYNRTINKVIICPPTNFPQRYVCLFAQMATSLLAFHAQTLSDLSLTHCLNQNYRESLPATPTTIQSLLSTLRMCQLTHLDLSHNKSIVYDLCEQLKNLPRLKKLVLTNNFLNVGPLISLLKAASTTNSTLEFIDLAHNMVATTDRRRSSIYNARSAFATQPQSENHPPLKINLTDNFLDPDIFTQPTHSLPLHGEKQGRSLIFYSSHDPLVNVESVIHPDAMITCELWLVFLYRDFRNGVCLLFEGINEHQQRFLKKYSFEAGRVETYFCLEPVYAIEAGDDHNYQGFLIPRFRVQQILKNIELDTQKRLSAHPIHSPDPRRYFLAWAVLMLREGGLNIYLPQPLPTPEKFLTARQLVDPPLRS